MATTYKLAVWDANGLMQHKLELQTFLVCQKIDIMMISETHFTEKSYLKINVIIIRNNITHYETNCYKKEHIQAANIVLQDWEGPITISAVYCPPRHAIKKEEFETYFQTLGSRFICGGDLNSKHQRWGSRLITPKGRELYKAMDSLGLDVIFTGAPTYWPSDKNYRMYLTSALSRG